MTDESSRGPAHDQWRGMTPADRGFTTPMADDVFAALSDWRRRAVCRYFATTAESAATVETLAAAVARRGRASSITTDDTTVEAIETELAESHLPALHDLGIVDFDARSQTVKYWGSPTVEKWVEHASAVTDRAEF